MAKEGARRAELASTPDERRSASRADLVIQVSYTSVDEIFSEFARNINEGGMFVATEAPPPVGAEVSIHFTLPGCDRPIVLATSMRAASLNRFLRPNSTPREVFSRLPKV